MKNFIVVFLTGETHSRVHHAIKLKKYLDIEVGNTVTFEGRVFYVDKIHEEKSTHTMTYTLIPRWLTKLEDYIDI